MTEKHYGGEAGFGYSFRSAKGKNSQTSNLNFNKKSKENKPNSDIEEEQIEKLEKVGKIAKDLMKWPYLTTLTVLEFVAVLPPISVPFNI